MDLGKLFITGGLLAAAGWLLAVPAPGLGRLAAAVLTGILGIAVGYVAVQNGRNPDSAGKKSVERPGERVSEDTNSHQERNQQRAGISRRRLLERGGSVPAVLSGIAAGWTAIATITYPVTYVWRVLAWRESDVSDYLSNFPTRELTAASAPFRFERALDEPRVTGAFEAVLPTDDFETFLAKTGTQAFIVIQDGRIRYESYFNGWRRDSMLTSFSVAKSFVSTLVGIAIEEDHIGSLDDPITKYLSELRERDPNFADITVRHLLTMSSGLAYSEFRWGLFNGDDPLTTYYPDQRHISLTNTHIVDPPDEYFQYNKYHPQLLGMIIERTTGMSVTDWTQRRVWGPLGMEFDGAWCLDSVDSGFEKMEAGLNARAVDFAKLGQLFLENGQLAGEQIVSPEWVALATGRDDSGRAPSYADESYYGFMWWGVEREGEQPDFAARGDRGQYIYVSPVHDTIIVRNGVEYGAEPQKWMEAFYDVASDPIE